MSPHQWYIGGYKSSRDPINLLITGKQSPQLQGTLSIPAVRICTCTKKTSAENNRAEYQGSQNGSPAVVGNVLAFSSFLTNFSDHCASITNDFEYFG